MGFLGLIILAAYCAFSEGKTATQCYTHRKGRETGGFFLFYSSNKMMTIARMQQNDAMCCPCVSKTVSTVQLHLERCLLS